MLQDSIALEKALSNVLDRNAFKRGISSELENKTMNSNLLNVNKLLLTEMKKISNGMNRSSSFKQKDPNTKIINELEQANSLAKENSKLLKNIGKAGGLLGDILKVGAVGGALGYLLFGNKKHLVDFVGDMVSSLKPLGGVVGGFLTGDHTKVVDNLKQIESGINKVMGDGVVSQILTGKYKPLNTMKGALEVQGGLFQGLLFGDWSLLKTGFKDLKDNLSGSQMGILGALLFGAPLAKGALTTLGGMITKFALASPVNAIAAASIGTAVTAIGFGVKAYLDKKDADKFRKEFNQKQQNRLLEEVNSREGVPDQIKKMAMDVDKEWRSVSQGLDKYKKGTKWWNAGKKRADELQEQYNVLMKEISMYKRKDEGVVSSSTSFDDIISPPSSFTDEVIINAINKNKGLIEKAAKDNPNLTPTQIASIMLQESGGRATAKSESEVKGLMQVTRDTAREMGVTGSDYWKPENSMYAGSKYLGQLVNQFGGFTPEAIRAYNAGPTGSRQFSEGTLNVPPNKMKEVEEYPKRVGGFHNELERLQKEGKIQWNFVGNNVPKQRVREPDKNEEMKVSLNEKDIDNLGKNIAYNISRIATNQPSGKSIPLVNPRGN